MKKKDILKKGRLVLCVVLCLLLVSTTGTAVLKVTENSSLQLESEFVEEEQDSVHISVDQQDEITQLTYHIDDFLEESVLIEGIEYQQLRLDDESHFTIKGMPDLPMICRSVIIPDNAKMNLRIVDAHYIEYQGVLIAPSKGILYRSVNPEDVPFEFDLIYSMDTIFPKHLAQLQDPYILRDFRSQVVQLNPFSYNPLRQTLRFYDEVTIEVFPDGVGTINCLTRDSVPVEIDTDFLQIYQHHFINYDRDRYTPVEEQGNMLVITYDDFWDEMVPFVQWKNMKGIATEMVNVSQFGSANAIKLFIEQYYVDNGLTFVLLVGDVAQVPTLYPSYGASDPSYSYIVGDDHYPDLFVGRFSAQNPTDLLTQIERTLEYEQVPQIGAEWYHQGLGVASDQGPGDDGEYDWEHIRNIRTLMMDYTYTLVDELYDGSQGGEDAPGDPTPSMVATSVNDGRSVINYCGHGSPTSWGSSGFSNSDINQLVNDNMLPYVWTVACNNGEFDNYDACFCEAWLRATHNGEPTGAIATFGSSIGQPWDPPMDAQDEFNNLLTEQYVDNVKHTIGGISFNGCMHMNDNYGSEGWSVTDTWHLFGDPSLYVRTDTPVDLIVDHDTIIFDGSTTYELDVPGVEGALCAISHNFVLLGSAYTDETGHAVITFDIPITDLENVDLVVTSYNAVPYMTTLDVVSKRQPAEFEPMQGILIRYPFGISFEIIAEMSEDVQVVTIVANQGEEDYVLGQYTSHGVNTGNCLFLQAPSDSYWTRDYGPWFVYDTEGNQAVVDFEYNRPRPNDNAIPAAFAAAYGLPLIDLNLIHTGGNYMTDGQGIAVSTDLVYTENPGVPQDELHNRMADILGIRTYHVVPDVLGEYIEHIDCWAKYLDPDTIMIIEVPPGHSQYNEIEAAVDYFESQPSCYGTPYEVVRVFTNYGEPYINSLILNSKVLVPVTGSGWDDEAIASYEAAMPGYEVLGFSGSWASTDALHCRTKGIPDQYMLYIEHTPLLDGYPSDDGFLVEARVTPLSGEPLLPGSPHLVWRTEFSDWEIIEMDALDNNRYEAFIPPVSCGEIVYYYIYAEDASGRSENHPYIGAPGAHHFLVTNVPEIWIDPLAFELQYPLETITVEELTIGNDEIAGEDLVLDISWTDNSGLGWLSVSPTSDILSPGESLLAEVSIDTYPLDVGQYQDSIFIESNDPDEPLLTVPVDLTVTYGIDTGVISIDSPDESIPAGLHTVSVTVENFGSIDQYNVPVHCEIMEGVFGTFLEEDFTSGVPPAGWTQEQAGEWNQVSSSYAGGVSPEAELSWYEISGDYAYLQSAAVDTIGAPYLTLEFKSRIDHYDATFTCRILARSSAGDDWIDVTPWSNPINGDISAQTYMVDVTSAIGPATQVRFEFDGYYWNLDYWYLDDVKLSCETRDPGDIVYEADTTVDVPAYSIATVEFSPAWQAEPAIYAIMSSTGLSGDQNPSNDEARKTVTVEEGLLGDINGDGVVNVEDLLILLANWGTSGPGDLNEDGIVNVLDLLILLANWT